MTKVQVQYELEHPIGDSEAEALANIHGVYGIMRVYVAPSLDRITVDYDATRMSEPVVEATLISNGLPIRRVPLENAESRP